MNVKPLLTGFAIGVLFALTPSCGPKVCNASNCRTGCCDAKGECQSGASQNACGQLGGLCQSCALGSACNLGTCMSTQLGGGPGGGTGGSSGGGTGGSSGGGTGGSNGGGTGGGTGGGAGCDGCLFNGSCISQANSNNDTLCGQGGVTCATCTGTFHCQNFVCVNTGTGGGGATGGGTGGGVTGGGTGGGVTGGGTGGGVTGGGSGSAFIGMPCTTTSQCTSLGSGAKCKTATVPFGANAPSNFPPGFGFCTVPCTGTCASGVCAGGPSTFPFLFNDTERFCTPTCTGPNTCPVSSLSCVQVTDLNVQGTAGCTFLRTPDAGLFTGGGNPTKPGNTCTTEADCANPPDPVLAVCGTSAQGFPNGYCLADSNFAPADTWCEASGKTEVGFTKSDGGVDFFCLGTCSTPGSVGTSRAGYTCFRKSATGAGASVGVLWPKCTMASDCAGDPQGNLACNTTSGFCCATATSTTGCTIDLLQ